ncbi:hypothetical protein ACNF49_30860 [Actinomadura sp. ATCC 39365]
MHGKVKLASGRIDALTFNGRAPGPQIRVKKGEQLEAVPALLSPVRSPRPAGAWLRIVAFAGERWTRAAYS